MALEEKYLKLIMQTVCQTVFDTFLKQNEVSVGALKIKSYLMYDLIHYLLAIISLQGNVKVVLSKNVGRRINKLITL